MTPSAAATRASVTASSPSASAIATAASTTCARSSPRRGTAQALPRAIAVSHRGARRLDHLAVARGEPGRAELAQRLRGLERGRVVPGRRGREREAPVALGGGGDAADRRVRVGAVQRAVAGVEERHLAGRVPGRGDHLERADPVAGRDRPRRRGLGAAVAAAQLALLLAGVERHVLGQQPRVARGDQHLGVGQRGVERVERADVILVGVGEGDPHDRARRAVSAAARIAFSDARHRGVDQREAVVLLDEVGVDEAEAVIDEWA